MKQKIFQVIALFIVLFLAACDRGDLDLTPPEMEVLTFDPIPTVGEICGSQEPDVFQLVGGDQLVFDVVFKDDQALSQYKVDIHSNFDCHGHGGGGAPSIVVPSINNQTTDWAILEIQEIEGTSAPAIRTYDIPMNVTTGNYHFQIQVIDESGNDNPSANFYTLNIKNPTDDTEPQIEVEEPVNSNFSVEKGGTISFVGQVTDDRSLSDGGNGVLYLAYTDLSSGNTFTTDEIFIFDENVDTVFGFDFDYTVPQTLVAGNYLFSLGANDGVRNVASFQIFEVVVTD